MSADEFLPAVGAGRHRHRGARRRRAHARNAGAHRSRRYARPRLPASARSSPCSTAPAGRRSAGMPTFPATRLQLSRADRAARTAMPSCEHRSATGRAPMRSRSAPKPAARSASADLAPGPERDRFSDIMRWNSHAPRRHPPAGRQRTHRRRFARARARGAGRAADAGRAGGGRTFRRLGRVIITSANAPGAIAGNPACAALFKLPLFAVGRRSADAARQAGFTDVTSAGGDVRDLVRLIAERRADASAPLLYLAGEDRAADLVGELVVHGIAAEMAVVYRAVTAPFPPELIAALTGRRGRRACCIFPSAAPRIISPARAQAGVAEQALGVRHIACRRRSPSRSPAPAPAASPWRRGRTRRR